MIENGIFFPISDLVNLQITELSVVVVKDCLNWKKTQALESKPKKTIMSENEGVQEI